MNIFDNPFYILGVSTRSNRQQILAAAEDKAFFLDDPKDINEACNALIIPSKRLAAEIRWFPGVPDNTVSEAVEFFCKLHSGQPAPKLAMSSFRSLALLNLAVYMFRFHSFKDVSDIAKSLSAIDTCFDTVTTEAICALLNRDRKAAVFPPVEIPELEREMKNYRRDMIRTLEETLTKRTPEEYTELSLKLAEHYAADEAKSLYITGDILDDYALSVMPDLEKQKEAVLDI